MSAPCRFINSFRAVRNTIRLQKSCASIILLLAITLSTCGCSRKEPVTLGFLGGLTGQSADVGIAGLNGATLAVEKTNLAGGINGVSLQLNIEDCRQSDELAVKQVKGMIEKGEKIIIAPIISRIAAAVIPVVNSSKTILLSSTVTSTDFNGKDDNFLRVCTSVDRFAAKSARYHYGKLGKRKAVIIYDDSNSSYTESWLTEFTTAFQESGARVISTIKFTSGKDRVFLDTARHILDTNVDLVVIIANSVDAASITQQLRKISPKITITIAEWASADRFLELTGKYSEGVYASQFIDRSSSASDYLTFNSEYQQRFGQQPCFIALATYDATMVAIEALRNRSLQAKTSKERILSMKKFKGVQHIIEFDRFGDSHPPAYLSVVRDGKYQTLE